MSVNARHPRPARRTTRRRRWAAVVALAVVVVVVAAAFAHMLTAATSPTTVAARPASISPSASSDPAVPTAPAGDAAAGAPGGAPGAGDRPPGQTRGETDIATDSVTVSTDVPTVTNLDPALRAALQHATTDAAQAGIEIPVTSGWRSADVQQQLLDDAVAQYGSLQEAEKWVATPRTSAHVSGDAVDLGPATATAWMSEHGATYGLCQIYANEPWHYELRPGAAADGCPPMYANPTQDPRMQQ